MIKKWNDFWYVLILDIQRYLSKISKYVLQWTPGFVIWTFCGISKYKIYALKELNTRRIDKSGRMFYVDGRWWKKKNKKPFFNSFYISFQFFPTFSWFRPLKGGGGGGKNANSLKPLKKVKIDSRRPLNLKNS